MTATSEGRISLLQITVEWCEEGAPSSGCEGGGFWCGMPKRLKRYYGEGQLHFVTFNCYRRLPLLVGVKSRNIFVKELGRVQREYGFLLVGYVVMPNHVHVLMSEPKKGTSEEREKAREAEGATAALSEIHRGPAAVPAAEVLRFQWIQPREEEREIGV